MSYYQHENRPGSTVQLKFCIVHKLTSWFGFQDQQIMLTSPENASPTQDAS